MKQISLKIDGLSTIDSITLIKILEVKKSISSFIIILNKLFRI